jgi:hypothetical protein
MVGIVFFRPEGTTCGAGMCGWGRTGLNPFFMLTSAVGDVGLSEMSAHVFMPSWHTLGVKGEGSGSGLLNVGTAGRCSVICLTTLTCWSKSSLGVGKRLNPQVLVVTKNIEKSAENSTFLTEICMKTSVEHELQSKMPWLFILHTTPRKADVQPAQ